MHTAFSASPILEGLKDKPDSILVHAGKLFVGLSNGGLLVYKLFDDVVPLSSSSAASTSSQQQQQQRQTTRAVPHETHRSFSRKAVEKLGVIKEANLLVSLSDGHVSLHDLSTMDLVSSLPQTKSAFTFALDVSIQREMAPASNRLMGPGPGTLSRATTSRSLAATARNWGTGVPTSTAGGGAGRAFRPSEAGSSTLRGTGGARFEGTISASGAAKNWQTLASLRGMDGLVKEREERLARARELAEMRSAGAALDEDEGAVMTLVSTLVVGCRRRVVVLRWVDGSFWDTKEIALPHSPRAFAFPTPTVLVMGYSATDYAILSIPLASSSSVAEARASGIAEASSASIPSNSTAGAKVDICEWSFTEFNMPAGQNLALGEGKGAEGAGGNATTAAQATAGGIGAAFGGLGGWMAKSGKPVLAATEKQEVLVCRDNMGVFLSAEGKPTRREGIEWPGVPEDVCYVRPYVFSVLPAGSVGAPLGTTNLPSLQVRSASTLVPVQTVPFPPPLSSGVIKAGVTASSSAFKPSSSSYPPLVNLLTPSSAAKPPLYLVVTPQDRGALEKEGATVWCLEMRSWGTQIDELVDAGKYEEALGLLDSVDEVLLEDKATRRTHVEILNAVSHFSAGRYDEAIETFIERDVNPARVISLYPESVAGPLARPRERWLEIFGGGKSGGRGEDKGGSGMEGDVSVEGAEGSFAPSASSRAGTPPPQAAAASASASGIPIPSGSPTPASSRAEPQAIPRDRSRLTSLFGRRPQSVVGEPSPSSPSSLASNMRKAGAEDDARSVRSVRPRGAGGTLPTTAAANEEERLASERQSLDALGRFLADRRRIFKPILEATPSSHSILSSLPASKDSSWLLALPDVPLPTLQMEELAAIARATDTALFKTFLATKPGLLGPLCRVENWCQVEMVEELLLERKRFSELIALYGGKEMHDKALALLKKFADDIDDVEEKVEPTIRYLQNLGPEHIDLILATSHWVLDADRELGMEIFCADTGKVASLPRHAIVADLEAFDPELCVVYLQHIIDVMDEGDPALHEKLALLLLRKAMTQDAPSTGEDGEMTSPRAQTVGTLLAFLTRSTQYRAERLLSKLPADAPDLYETRALLLGRMGQHEAALSIYVNRLRSHDKAEEYCKRIYAEASQDSKQDREVFLTLLRIYLRPSQQQQQQGTSSSAKSDEASSTLQLEPALALISRHGARLDPTAALNLLPPLVSLKELKDFAAKTLRQSSARRDESRVLAQICRERDLQVTEGVNRLQMRRVKISETRTCPRCLKRLGNSVIAVTTTGAVLHYSCR